MTASNYSHRMRDKARAHGKQAHKTRWDYKSKQEVERIDKLFRRQDVRRALGK